ncbi:hypothetical protein [Rhodococcus sp. ACPA1]|uniref:hypothetical protein n=1 Tax=Rhodococcus sp. ACPA1 TaxID=2028572 RepID=UPI000BB12703|nr:hypothetical protein [Rhodococcus sp. ACPA1]PBC53674.1 hypothetical protein CJ177_31985 [Rhodococcus sp. ACPA1]
MTSNDAPSARPASLTMTVLMTPYMANFSGNVPTVMLIHGLASSCRVWDQVVPKIEAKANIVAA